MNKISRLLRPSLAVAAVLACAAGAHAAAPPPAPTLFDHYLCYKGALSKGETKFVNPFPNKTLVDQFENRTYDAKNPLWHCNPVKVTDNGIIPSSNCSAGDPAKLHTPCTADADCDGPTPTTGNGVCSVLNFPNVSLEGYPISLTKTVVPQLPDVKPNITTVDQFGLLRLKVTKPESVNVRTSEEIIAQGPTYAACSPTKFCNSPNVCVPAAGGFCVSTADFLAPPANDGSVDNFKCYAVGLNKQKFTKIVNQVSFQDQFWSPHYTYDIVKPTRVCTPVDKNGENVDAPTHPGHLVCYQILGKNVPAGTLPPKDKYAGNKVAESNGNFPDNRLDVKTVNELCVPATKAVCGNGVVEPPYEECDAPKICSGGVNNGQPCTKATDCASPGKCVPNTTQCPAGVACSANCTCPLPPPPIAADDSNAFCKGPGNPLACCTGPQAGTCPCPVYHEAGYFLDICSTFGSACGPPQTVPALPLFTVETTFNLCTSAADANGMRALTVDPETWFSDAIHIPAPPAPFESTIRLCPTAPMSGVLFTKANASTAPPAKFCLTGDPALLRNAACLNDAWCDGPPPTTGNGVCAGRDLDYTSVTNLAGTPLTTSTTFTLGDGIADAAGSAMFAQDLQSAVWIGNQTCTGTGSDPTCVSCDDTTPAPAGRTGISASAGPPILSFPLITRFTTGSAENIVNQTGNILNGREVSGSGAPSLTASLVMVGGNAALLGGSGSLQLQFFTKQIFAPLVP